MSVIPWVLDTNPMLPVVLSSVEDPEPHGSAEKGGRVSVEGACTWDRCRAEWRVCCGHAFSCCAVFCCCLCRCRCSCILVYSLVYSLVYFMLPVCELPRCVPLQNMHPCTAHSEMLSETGSSGTATTTATPDYKSKSRSKSKSSNKSKGKSKSNSNS